MKYNSYKKNIDSRLRRFEDELYLSDEEFTNVFVDRFNEELNYDMWKAFLWNEKTGEILYDSSDIRNENIEYTKKDLKYLLSSYAVIDKGDIQGIFGVSTAYIDEIVKTEIGDLIRMRSYSSESYIWINEVINYDGGKDYAVRRVHPNLLDEEGSYLSTDMEDVDGNLPYLDELEGIKKSGEIFSNYYFKKLNSSDISEKITYAKLYKDFNWIVAMGVHLDNIDTYTEQVTSEINALSSESIIRWMGYTLIILLIGFTILYFIESKHLATSTRSLEKEVNLDLLTKAASRRSGEQSLNAFYKEYISNDSNTAIMMFDIDDFKKVNDQYGHEVGDSVLIETVRSINQFIRSSDHLIRWGGDEFVGILPTLREEDVMKFGAELLDEISSLEIPIENGSVSITVSIGFSFFKNTDSDYNDVLKRADDAMYQSKAQKKNKVNIIV